MNETGRQIFLLLSILGLMSSIIIFSTFYAPELLSTDTSNPETKNNAAETQKEEFTTDNKLLNQSITGLQQLYHDAVEGTSLLFQINQST